MAAACGARSSISHSAASTAGGTGGASSSSSVGTGGDACSGVVCQSPPSVCYEPAGTCANGACSYAFADGTPCSNGFASPGVCQGGMCTGGPAVCDTPPAPVCVSATTLRTYGGTGTFADGGCSYGFTDSACASQCSGGACVTTGKAVAIAVGDGTACAVLSAGSVVCWGNDSQGELGTWSAGGEEPVGPIAVPGLLGSASAVAVGGEHVCALTDRVLCWGDNEFGQLGNGSQNAMANPTPVEVVGLGGGGVTSISAGADGDYTCAVKNGGVVCWGDGAKGQLGNGTTQGSPVPVDVMGLPGNMVAVSAGSAHTCALTSGGGVLCWGDNSRGQLGNGTTTASPVPVGVVGLSSGILAVSAGYNHTCALTASRTVVCWGDDHDGELGDGHATDNLVTTPIAATAAGSNVMGISAGWGYTCAFTVDGTLACWGADDMGQLGDAASDGVNFEWQTTPVVPKGLTAAVVSVSASHRNTCAVLSDGTAMCWGENDGGELGEGMTGSPGLPVTVVGL